MEIFAIAIAVSFGLIVGSFINVVILRLPEGKGVAWDRSACRSCSTQLSWYENIPVVSYVLLLGRCRSCKAPISIQYPVIEVIHGFFAFLLLADWPQLTHEQLLYQLCLFILTSILIAHFIIDLRHQLLMDKLNLVLLMPVAVMIFLDSRYINAAIGGAFGFFVPLIVTWVFYKLSGKIGLGGGDIKLFGIIGLLFGVQGVLLNLFTSCILGSVVTLILIATKRVQRDQYIPFGPYIILVTFAQVYVPELVERWRFFLFPY